MTDVNVYDSDEVCFIRTEDVSKEAWLSLIVLASSLAQDRPSKIGPRSIILPRKHVVELAALFALAVAPPAEVRSERA